MLNLLLGVLLRRTTSEKTQNALGRGLFWVLGIPLLVMLVGFLGFMAYAVWLAQTGQKL